MCAATSMMANGSGVRLGSRLWRPLSPRAQQPVAAVWFVAALSFCIGLPAVLLPEHWGHDSQVVTQLQTHISHSSPHLPVWRDSQHLSFVEQCRSRLSVQALSTWLGSQASEVLHDPPSPSSCEEGEEQYSALRSLMEDPLSTQGSLLLQPSQPGGQQQLGHVALRQWQRSASQRSSGPLELELSLPHSSAPEQYPLPPASRAAAQGAYTNTLFTTAESASTSALQPLRLGQVMS
ncbi:hypothetical protein V8C86DRAFT_3132019 [Haematococcus lacustris]